MVDAQGLRRLAASIQDLLYPQDCLLCRRCVELEGADFCPTCQPLWAADSTPPACPTCAATCAHGTAPDERCPACRGKRLPVQGVVRLGVYGDALSTLVRRLKYQGDGRVARRLGERLAQELLQRPWVGELDAVVPVPSAWSRRLVRPLHAPTELATFITRRLQRAIPPRAGGRRRLDVLPLLECIGHPKTQTGMTPQERRLNVRGKFRPVRGVEVHGATILLVDDVVTSRATSFECARTLLSCGAERVYVAAVAKTEPPTPMRHTRLRDAGAA